MSRGASARTAARSVAHDARTIFIEKTAVVVEPKQIPLDKIRLDPSNPRIQHAVKRAMKNGPLSQDRLCALILEQPGVPDLFKSIRENGGLLEPIYVRPDGRVIEGNCRAASYLRLHRAAHGDKRWRTIPALLLPIISDRQVAVLQGHFHVAGKNKWRAYEKAGHLHTMHTKLGMDAKAIGCALGMQERVVTRLLQAYRTMTEEVLPRMKSGHGLDKWSHVEEFFKNKELEQYRGKPAQVTEFVDLVVNNKVRHGADVRKLPRILKHSRAARVLKKEGVERAISVVGQSDPTADSPVFKKLKEMTALLQGLTARDLQRLRAEKKPQQLLAGLFTALKDVAKAAGLKRF
jgi:hypothetical protein